MGFTITVVSQKYSYPWFQGNSLWDISSVVFNSLSVSNIYSSGEKATLLKTIAHDLGIVWFWVIEVLLINSIIKLFVLLLINAHIINRAETQTSEFMR